MLLHQEGSIKSQKYRQRASWLVNTTTPEGRQHPDSMGTEAPVLEPSQTSPYVPLHLAVHLHFIMSFNKLLNVSISLSSVTCSNKLI